MVGLVVWLIILFVDGLYYICVVVGLSIEKRNIINVIVIKDLEV